MIFFQTGSFFIWSRHFLVTILLAFFMLFGLMGCETMEIRFGDPLLTRPAKQDPLPSKAEGCNEWAEKQTQRTLSAELLHQDDGSDNRLQSMLLDEDYRRLKQNYRTTCLGQFGTNS